jgi:hypothetical protein
MDDSENNPVRVKFENNATVWNIVNADLELMVVEEEDSEYFIVEYDDQDEWEAALTRFDGMVDYQVLPS